MPKHQSKTRFQENFRPPKGKIPQEVIIIIGERLNFLLQLNNNFLSQNPTNLAYGGDTTLFTNLLIKNTKIGASSSHTSRS